MKPEDKARQEIDRQLVQCGWIVQDHSQMNISAGPVAVREFPLSTGFADYLLYVDAKAIGVIEAKPEGHTLTGVETQSAKYTEGLPAGLPAYHLPLPFAYESTGKVTQFTNSLEPDARSREVFTFHQPEELLRLVNVPAQVRQGLRTLPPLKIEGLRKVQVTAIHNLEESLAKNRPRALIQMATGTGKTFTAVTLNYRLIKFAGAIFYAQGVKANVLFFDAKPAQEKAWTKRLWVYDLRTNMHFTLKQNTLKRADLDEFVECYKPGERHKRRQKWSEKNPEGRWRGF